MRMRWATRIAAALVALVLLAGLVAAYLFHSEPFTRWLFDTVASRSDGAVRVEAVTGTLSAGVRIARVDVDLDGVAAGVESVEFSVDWRSLVARSIVVDSLRIGRAQVDLQPAADSTAAAPSSTGFSALVLIRELRIDEIEVSAYGQPYAVRDLALELRVLRNHLELTGVEGSYEALRFAGDAAFTLTEEIDIDADVCLDGMIAGESLRGCVSAEGTPRALELTAQTQAPFPVSARGSVALTGDESLDVEASWEDAALAALPDFASARGSVRVTGSYRNPQVVADGLVAYAGREAQLSAEVRVAEAELEIERLLLERDGMAAEISGTFARDLGSAELAAELRDFDPQQISQTWPAASLDLRARVSVRLQPSLEIVASDLVVGGDIRDAPVVATGAVAWTGDALNVDSLQIVSRSDRVEFSGRIGQTLDVDVVASMADIGLLLPGFSGALSAEAEITGPRMQPFARGVVSVEDLDSSELSVGMIRISGSAGLASDDVMELAISVSGASVYGQSVDDAVATLTGTAATHRLEARTTAQGWSAALAADGALSADAWEGRIEALEIAPEDFGTWRLVAPVAASYGLAGYAVDEMCLAYTLSQICAGVSVAGVDTDALSVAATNFDVGILAAYMPEGIRVRGLVNGRGEISGFIDAPRGEIELETEDAQVDIAVAEGEALQVPIRQLRLAALFDDTGATASATLDAAELGSATAAFAVSDPRSANPGLRGAVNAHWSNAAALAMLTPDVDNVNGRIDAQMQVGGTLYSPLVSGSAGLADGSLEIPAWGLVVEQITASATANESREASFDAQGSIDGKLVNIDGTVFLDPQQGWPMQLRLSGEDLSLVQLTDFEMLVSPALEANVRLPEIEVTGVVGIPSARIREVALPQQAVVPSADTVIHGRVIEERPRPLIVTASLTLDLGDDVRYEDANIDALVSGRLDLDYRSGQGAAAVGELGLSGEYIAYGNALALERGQLIFVGPWNNPSLDIRAVRRIGEVTAGVQVTGTLRAPIAMIFSEPAMSEANALSWLLFGEPLDDVRAAESDALRGAALSMGLQQALPAIERIGESLGFDDFAIRNTEADASEIMAGKYLSPNLYFRYSYGLFNRIGGILLRYRINERFSLETRSGEHNSMDLFYTVEKE